MKKGFTLAEVLITLGIIGVVAALTMPSLNLNVNEAKIYPQLQKAMNTLQTAVDLAMAENPGMPLSACVSSGQTISTTGSSHGWEVFKYCLLPKMRGTVINSSAELTGDANKTMDYTNYNRGDKGVAEGESGSFEATLKAGFTDEFVRAIKTKDGIFMFPFTSWSYGPNASHNMSTSDTLVMYMVLVDINGYEKGPNSFGKDAFIFGIDSSTGEVYPFGGKAYHDLAANPPNGLEDWVSNEMNPTATQENPEPEADYTNNPYWGNKNCDAEGMKSPSTCAGSIFDNGGKIIYNMN